MNHSDNCECAKCFAAINNDRLRNQFAMAALVNCSDHIGNPEDMAREAYTIADAMMKAREGK